MIRSQIDKICASKTKQIKTCKSLLEQQTPNKHPCDTVMCMLTGYSAKAAWSLYTQKTTGNNISCTHASAILLSSDLPTVHEQRKNP